MPCRDYAFELEPVQDYCAERDKLASLLCTACEKIAIKSPDITTWPKKLSTWWLAHQAADQLQIANEKAELKKKQLKNQALNKLTNEERKALGL